MFRDLLNDESSGEYKSTLQLPGKSKEDFDLFLQALLPASMRFHTLADEGVYMSLVRWAHEFEVANLRELCEDHLIKSVAVDEASLGHALEYGLQRRLAQCLAEMKTDLPRYVDVLGSLAAGDTTRPQLEELWPLLCEAAAVTPYELPPSDHVRALWPFIASSIRSSHGSAVTEVAEKVAADIKKSVYEATAALPEAFTERAAVLNETANSYAGYAYKSFWANASYLQDTLYSYAGVSAGPAIAK